MKYYTKHYTTVEGKIHTYRNGPGKDKRLPRPVVTRAMGDMSKTVGRANAAEMYKVSVYDIDRARKLVSMG